MIEWVAASFSVFIRIVRNVPDIIWGLVTNHLEQNIINHASLFLIEVSQSLQIPNSSVLHKWFNARNNLSMEALQTVHAGVVQYVREGRWRWQHSRMLHCGAQACRMGWVSIDEDFLKGVLIGWHWRVVKDDGLGNQKWVYQYLSTPVGVPRQSFDHK